MIRGFLFDLDGTLIHSERETAEAMARAMKGALGIEITQSDRDYVVGRSWVAIHDRLQARYPAMTWTRGELIAHVAVEREQVIAESGVLVLPGACNTLTWTRAQGKRALVTGSSRAEVAQVLHFLGPDAVFDTIVAAEDVPRSKPAPDGYRAAISSLALDPAECLVIEDSVSGIAAGRAAGCLVVAVRAGNFGGWDQSGAHRVVDTLDDVTPALVDSLVKDYGVRVGAGS